MNRLFKVIAFLFAFCFATNIFAQEANSSRFANSALVANRQTALRCFNSASDYAVKENWQETLSLLELGLNYDDTISDLWYLSAVASHKLGKKKSHVIALAKKSIEVANWENYNRDNARILYADLLADTMHFNEVEDILDESPYIYSSDAEYIRAKALYRKGDIQSIKLARSKIASAKQIYPTDTRFPLLFFKYESPYSEDAEVRNLADYFVAQTSYYAENSTEKDSELEIYAASFARGETQSRLLKSFAARSLKHPLYASVALSAGILSQREALKYLASFADQEIEYIYIVRFMRLLTDKDALKLAGEYFNSYGGTIVRDTGGDGIADLTVKYYRGRPLVIQYDIDQDGIYEWSIDCDFGVPISGLCNITSESSLQVFGFNWKKYPFLSEVMYKNTGKVYSLVEDTLQWSPVSVVPDSVILASTGVQFFFPVLNVVEQGISENMLLTSCSNFTVPSAERSGATIKVSVLNGVEQVADYYANNRLYARLQFKDGIPALRIVDGNDDGLFETTEYYSLYEDEIKTIYSAEDEKAITKNIYGVSSNFAQFYLKMVQVDRNGDNISDFTEEYIPNGGKIVSWDTDKDGNWNSRYILYAPDESGVIVEDSLFYDETENAFITVTTENSIPVKVKSQKEEYVYELSVKKDESQDFYWIGDTGSTSIAKKALDICNKKDMQGVSFIVEENSERVLAIRIGCFSYGKVIPNKNLTEETFSVKNEKDKN